MVIVNTVVVVKSGFGLGDREVALALAAFGAGSMVAALALPRLLERVPDRRAMLTGAGVLGAGMLISPLAGSLTSLMPLWFVLGLGYSLTQTPTGRLLRRSAHAEDRPALFAAGFALSHACWLGTYPLAGWLGAATGLDATFLVMAALSVAAVVAASRLWPSTDPEVIPHVHTDLDAGDPHLAAMPLDLQGRHAHAFVIDERHSIWPRPA